MALVGLYKREQDSTGDDDARLMAACRDGDEEAFVQLYQRYRDRMVNYCRRMLGSAAAGEDAAQEVFLKIYRARARYQPKSRFSTYVYRVATNHCFNEKAKGKRRRTSVDAEIERHGRAPSQQRDAEQSEALDALRGALCELPANQRSALLLCHYEGLSQREAAVVLELSESAVKALVHRAREKLVQQLAAHLRREGEVA